MIRLAIGCLVLSAGLAAQADGASAVARQSDRAIERLAADTGRNARILTHPATGVARFVRVEPGSLALGSATPLSDANEFLVRYGAAFGISDPASELSDPDVRAIAHDCLRHRLILSYEASADGITPDQVISEIIKNVGVA